MAVPMSTASTTSWWEWQRRQHLDPVKDEARCAGAGIRHILTRQSGRGGVEHDAATDVARLDGDRGNAARRLGAGEQRGDPR